MRKTRIGKLCVKHPELGGLRTVANRACVACADIASKNWRLAHAEEVKERRKKNYLMYREKSPEKIVESQKRYYEKNYDVFVQRAIVRKRLIQNQMPKWANIDAINEIYRKARAAGQSVDHIVPLRGKTVSGLHVEHNLQIIPLSENCSKRNKFDSGTIAAALDGGRL